MVEFPPPMAQVVALEKTCGAPGWTAHIHGRFDVVRPDIGAPFYSESQMRLVVKLAAAEERARIAATLTPDA